MATFLAMLYALLGFSVIVSLFGMINTLVLSVFERTREIGMLRTTGMTRRQARRMIRHESLITALIGAALGLGPRLGARGAGDRQGASAAGDPVPDAGRLHAGRRAAGHRRRRHARAPRLATRRPRVAALRVGGSDPPRRVVHRRGDPTRARGGFFTEDPPGVCARAAADPAFEIRSRPCCYQAGIRRLGHRFDSPRLRHHAIDSEGRVRSARTSGAISFHCHVTDPAAIRSC